MPKRGTRQDQGHIAAKQGGSASNDFREQSAVPGQLTVKRPHRGFDNRDGMQVAELLRERFGKEDSWEIFPEARAIRLGGPKILERHVNALMMLVYDVIGGGVIFWKDGDSRRVVEKAYSVLLAHHIRQDHRSYEAVSPPRGPTLESYQRPAKPVEFQWAGLKCKGLLFGEVESYFEKLARLKPGQGRRLAEFEAIWANDAELYERLKEDAHQKSLRDKVRAFPLGNKKLETEQADSSSFARSTPASEGPIKRTPVPGFEKLPAKPERLWPGGSRGKREAEASQVLIAFLREVYGPFFATFRNELRGFIFKHDKRLYQAIADFERTRKLPKDIAMPSSREKVRARFQRATRKGLDSLERDDRRSVTAALLRRERNSMK